MTEPAQAFGWDDLWLNKNQQGQQKLAEGLPQDAAQLFEDPQWQAVSNYRSGNYAPSAAAFAENDDANSLYNLGNALARSSEYASAIDAYDQALQLIYLQFWNPRRCANPACQWRLRDRPQRQYRRAKTGGK